MHGSKRRTAQDILNEPSQVHTDDVLAEKVRPFLREGQDDDI